MVQIPTTPRKLKRYLENEFYAKDARFWEGKVRTADRIDDVSRAINKSALNQQSGRHKARAKKPTEKPEGQVRSRSVTGLVYVLKFTLISDPSIKFLKIGITRHNIETRFAADKDRYQIDIIHQIIDVGGNYALALESALHRAFRGFRYRPPNPLLSGGNSECFVYNEEIEHRMKRLFEETLGFEKKPKLQR